MKRLNEMAEPEAKMRIAELEQQLSDKESELSGAISSYRNLNWRFAMFTVKFLGMRSALTSLNGLFAQAGVGISEPEKGFGEQPQDLERCTRELVEMLNETTAVNSARNTSQSDDQITSGLTSDDKYKAELYDEVWSKARDMGYGNVTNALDALKSLKSQAVSPKMHAGVTGGELVGRIPLDPRNGGPKITNGMKSQCIGEFSFTREATCIRCYSEGADDGCELCGGQLQYCETIVLPWDTCREVYKEMAAIAMGAESARFIKPEEVAAEWTRMQEQIELARSALDYARQVIACVADKAHSKADRDYCSRILAPANTIDETLASLATPEAAPEYRCYACGEATSPPSPYKMYVACSQGHLTSELAARTLQPSQDQPAGENK